MITAIKLAMNAFSDFSQYQTQAASAEMEAASLDFAERETVKMGVEKLNLQGEEAARRSSNVRTHYAKAGIDLGAGVAKRAQAEQRRANDIEALGIQNQYNSQALKFRQSSEQLKTQAKIFKRAGTTSLLSGLALAGFSGASSWQQSTKKLEADQAKELGHWPTVRADLQAQNPGKEITNKMVGNEINRRKDEAAKGNYKFKSYRKFQITGWY